MPAMKIYTKGGDQGETGLFSGARVPKNHVRIQAYGDLDELNAILGLVLGQDKVPTPLYDRLFRIQNELFQLGAELATPSNVKSSVIVLGLQAISMLEDEIDEMQKQVPTLKNFILPGGIELSALLHFARTVCRRMERHLVDLCQAESVRPEVLCYINRLSDHLFVCARWANANNGVKDVAWIAPKK